MTRVTRVLFFLTIVTTYLFSMSADSYMITWAAYIVFTIAGALLIAKRGWLLRVHKEIVIFALFVVYCWISLLWAKYNRNQSVSFMLMMVVFMTLACNAFQTEEDCIFLLKANIWASVILSIYTPLSYGFSNYIYAMLNGMRMGAEVGGENTVGICTAMAIVMALGVYLFERKKIYLAAMVSMLFISFSTGSRMALLTLISGVLIMLFIYYHMTSRDKVKSFCKIILLSVSVLAIGYFILKSVPMFHRLFVRFDEMIQVLLGNLDSTEGIGENRIRTILIREGLRAFKESPIFGIGYNNGRYLVDFRGTGSYSLHNNYVDVLCGGGIIGFTIFYSLYAVLSVKLIRRIKNNSWVAGVAFATLILNLIGHISGIFYLLKFFYPWLIFWITAANLPCTFVAKDEEKNDDCCK